jgi:hypothetical protein
MLEILISGMPNILMFTELSKEKKLYRGNNPHPHLHRDGNFEVVVASKTEAVSTSEDEWAVLDGRNNLSGQNHL